MLISALILLFLILGMLIGVLIPFQSRLSLQATEGDATSDRRRNVSSIWQIVFHLIENESTMLELLQEGKLDVIGPLFSLEYLKDPSSLAASNVTIRFFSARMFNALFFACNEWPATERGLRKGLAFALNKTRVGEIAWGRHVLPIDDPLTRIISGWSTRNAQVLEENMTWGYSPPDLVRGNLSLLRDGFYDIDGDGWREWYHGKNSSTDWEELVNVSAFNPDVSNPSAIIARESGPNPDAFPVSNLTIFNDLNNWKNTSISIARQVRDSSTINAINEVLIHALSSLGIPSEVVDLPPPTSPVLPPKYHLIYIPDVTATNVRSFIRSITHALRSSFQWQNETFYNITSAILQARTIEQAMTLAKEARSIIWEEQPFIPLFIKQVPFLFRHDRFKGWVSTPDAGIINYWSFLNVTSINGGGNSGKNQENILHVGMMKQIDQFSSMFSLLGLFNECTSGFQCFNALSLLFDTLWKKDPVTGEIIPWLADSWEQEIVYNDTLEPFTGDVNAANLSDLAVRITFHLNRQFRWHDGRPVLPEDVVFTYQFIQEHAYWFQSSLTKKMGGSINPRRITINEDNKTVSMILESISYLSFQDTGAFILPKHVFEPLLSDTASDDFMLLENPPKIGSGPYKWYHDSNDSIIILERNSEWQFGIDIGGDDTSKSKETSNQTTFHVNQTSSLSNGKSDTTSSNFLEMRVPSFEGWALLTSFLSLSLLTTLVSFESQKRGLKKNQKL